MDTGVREPGAESPAVVDATTQEFRYCPRTWGMSATNAVASCEFLTRPSNVTWFVSDQMSRPVSSTTKGHWAPKRRQRKYATVPVSR